MLYNGEIFAIDVDALERYDGGFSFFDAQKLSQFDS